SQWFGPGQAAQAWLSQVQAPTGESVRTQASGYGKDPVHRSGEHGNVQSGSQEDGTTLLDAARSSYYGGWFEIFAHGHIPEITWEYDINSAYPHIISQLPCILHGRWRHGRDINTRPHGGRSYQLCYATVVGSHPRIGAMLHRTEDHTIRRPLRTKG